MDSSKPAICGHRKSGHFRRPETGVEFLLHGVLCSQGRLDLGAPASRPALQHVRVMEEAVEQRGDSAAGSGRWARRVRAWRWRPLRRRRDRASWRGRGRRGCDGRRRRRRDGAVAGSAMAAAPSAPIAVGLLTDLPSSIASNSGGDQSGRDHSASGPPRGPHDGQDDGGGCAPSLSILSVHAVRSPVQSTA